MKALHSVSRSHALAPLRSLFGAAALAATFALTSPGVQIARAGDSAVADVQAPELGRTRSRRAGRRSCGTEL